MYTNMRILKARLTTSTWYGNFIQGGVLRIGSSEDLLFPQIDVHYENIRILEISTF